MVLLTLTTKVRRVSDLTAEDRAEIDCLAFEALGKKVKERLKAKLARPEYLVSVHAGGPVAYCGFLTREIVFDGKLATCAGITRPVFRPGSESAALHCLIAAVRENQGLAPVLYFTRGDKLWLSGLGFVPFMGRIEADAPFHTPLILGGPTQGTIDLRGLPW